jgi:hypothetical protein
MNAGKIERGDVFPVGHEIFHRKSDRNHMGLF